MVFIPSFITVFCNLPSLPAIFSVFFCYSQVHQANKLLYLVLVLDYFTFDVMSVFSIWAVIFETTIMCLFDFAYGLLFMLWRFKALSQKFQL